MAHENFHTKPRMFTVPWEILLWSTASLLKSGQCYYISKGGNSSVGRAPQWKSQMQYWRGFKSPVWHGIFLWELTPLWCLYSLCVQSHALLRAHITNPICWQPCHCLDTKIPHTLIWLSNTALTGAVPHPDNMTPISWKGWRSTKQIKEKKRKKRGNK